MPIHIAHELRATIQAPIETVWTRLGAFADTSWNPGIASSVLIGDEGVPGAVRVMTALDGSIIRERLEALGPDYSFTYTFDGAAPIPVLSSRTTVTATRSDESAVPATRIVWHGEFGVTDLDMQRTVEHLNLTIVWPRLIEGLASAIGVGYALDTAHATPTEK